MGLEPLELAQADSWLDLFDYISTDQSRGGSICRERGVNRDRFAKGSSGRSCEFERDDVDLG